MHHYVTLLFDTEDLCWPGSDDIALDLARISTRNQMLGTFCVVGEKARLWRSRGRADIIAALGPHDISLHTDRHSIHPTVSEYLAACGWHDGVAEALRYESPGFESHRQIFERPATSWSQAGGTWGPQIHAALSQAGVACAIYPATCTASSDVHWYAGALTFSGNDMAVFDTGMLDAISFDACMAAMYELLDRRIAAGQTWTGIFVCHPTMLRATQFWDQLNFAAGRNTDPSHYRMPELHPEASYQLALRNFETLLQALRGDSRLEVRTIAELREVYRPPEQAVPPEVVRGAAQKFVAALDDVPTDDPRLSPAEVVDLMARALLSGQDARLVRRTIDGPIEEPPAVAKPDIAWAELLAACESLNRFVEANRHLPASLETAAGPIGIGAFGRAAAQALLARDAGDPPARLALTSGRQIPAIADAIAERVRAGIAHWPIHDPQIDPRRILLHTRLQCWTLRPALVRG